MTKFSGQNPSVFFSRPISSQSKSWSRRDSVKGELVKKQRSKPTTVAPSEPQMVEIRNARERSRVRAVNEAYEKLRKMVPAISNRRKRVSKVKTLQKAAQYIQV
ncbi:Helix-loop-helix DNA-binding domain superfamily [Sergentomyia squamirostris]